jgi:hypothetical protein
MTRQYRQLVLCPGGETQAVAPAQMVSTLHDLGVIADRVHPQWPHRYYIGERFLQYLTFMGCAPALEFSPADHAQPDWTAFTYVCVAPPMEAMQCYIDTQMAKPLCPHCGKRHVLSNNVLTEQLTCPKCEKSAALDLWDFREFGGCARQFVRIVNVYPKESLPTESLLQHLYTKTQLHWRYFYINDGLHDDFN